MVDGQGGREDVLLPRTNQLMASSVQVTDTDGAAVALLTSRARARDLLCASDAVAGRIDELQFTIGHGPCLEAFIEQAPVTVPDLDDSAVTDRWPAFASEVVGELGVYAVFAFPIVAGGAPLGVLELYRYERGALTTNHFQAAQTLADELGTVVVDELQAYEGSPEVDEYPVPRGPHVWARADINAAIGIMAVRLGVPAAEAAVLLRANAYAQSRTLVTLAGDIVERRTFPG